jgi:hypothetical protein
VLVEKESAAAGTALQHCDARFAAARCIDNRRKAVAQAEADDDGG